VESFLLVYSTFNPTSIHGPQITVMLVFFKEIYDPVRGGVMNKIFFIAVILCCSSLHAETREERASSLKAKEMETLSRSLLDAHIICVLSQSEERGLQPEQAVDLATAIASECNIHVSRWRQVTIERIKYLLDGVSERTMASSIEKVEEQYRLFGQRAKDFALNMILKKRAGASKEQQPTPSNSQGSSPQKI